MILAALLGDLAVAAPVAGPVPGAPDLLVTIKVDGAVCGGQGYQVIQRKRRGVPPAAVDFARAMTLAFPRDLAIDPGDPEKSAAAMRRFATWVTDATKVMKVARERYLKIASDKAAAPEARVVAAARIAQLERHFATLLVTAAIPPKLTMGADARDTIIAFCATMGEQGAPLAREADEAASMCGRLAADAHLAPGWWDAVCTAPAAPSAKP